MTCICFWINSHHRYGRIRWNPSSCNPITPIVNTGVTAIISPGISSRGINIFLIEHYKYMSYDYWGMFTFVDCSRCRSLIGNKPSMIKIMVAPHMGNQTIVAQLKTKQTNKQTNKKNRHIYIYIYLTSGIQWEQGTLNYAIYLHICLCVMRNEASFHYTVRVCMCQCWLLYIYSAHYSDVIMSAMVYLIIGISIVNSAVCSGADQRKHQSSELLAFVRGIHRWPVNSRTKGH